jgi:hypothetical protein
MSRLAKEGKQTQLTQWGKKNENLKDEIDGDILLVAGA